MKILQPVFALVLFSVVASAQAEVAFEKHVPSNHSNGKVEINAGQGSLTIIGWDKNEVSITGTIGDRVERLDVAKGNRKIKVRAFTPKDGQERDVHLVIRAPHNNDINVLVFQGPISVSGIEGDIQLDTFGGDITVVGACKRVEAATVSGNIRIENGTSEFAADKARVKTVAGRIDIQKVRRELDAETINGPVTIAGTGYMKVAVETVSGDVRFEGSVSPAGQLRIETHGGEITGAFPANFVADFDITSYNGSVENAFRQVAENEQAAIREDGESLAEVKATSFSGDIRLTKQSQPQSTAARAESQKITLQ